MVSPKRAELIFYANGQTVNILIHWIVVYAWVHTPGYFWDLVLVGWIVSQCWVSLLAWLPERKDAAPWPWTSEALVAVVLEDRRRYPAILTLSLRLGSFCLCRPATRSFFCSTKSAAVWQFSWFPSLGGRKPVGPRGQPPTGRVGMHQWTRTAGVRKTFPFLFRGPFVFAAINSSNSTQEWIICYISDNF